MNRRKNDKLKSVVVFLEFDSHLQSITGISRTHVEVTEGTPFIMLLQAVLESYPDLMETFHHHALGFEVNGRVPNPHFLLTAHDVISVGIHDPDGHSDSSGPAYYH